MRTDNCFEKPVLINLDINLYETLVEVCNELDMSLTSFIRIAIYEKIDFETAYLNEEKLLNDYF